MELIEVGCSVCGSSDSQELLALHDSAYHCCNQCGMIYAKRIARDYDELNEQAFAAELDDYARKVESKKRTYEKKLRPFERYRSTGNFLEIGSNTGGLLVAARAKGWDVKGVDISNAACQFAREQFGLDVYAGTLQSAQFPNDYFDVIFSNATLEHVRDLLPLMKESVRVLRPGGVFYADTVNWDSYTREILGRDWKLIHPTHHVHLFTPQNIRTLCEYSGLKHVKTWTSGVRVKANARPSTFETSWYLNLMKGPLSALTRVTQKGDSIEFLAMKP